MLNKKNVSVTSFRIPDNLNEKITKIARGENISKTKVILSILYKYFNDIDDSNDEIIASINDAFSIENKIFMPIQLYKQLFAKSDSDIENDISKNLIIKKEIKNNIYLIYEVSKSTNAIALECLNLKKEIEILKSKIDNVLLTKA